MKAKRIKLKSLKNTRDIGGYRTADGRVIKQGMLIRSCHLSDACAEDIKILTDKYNLRTVIDLRIDNEVEEKPDKLPDSVRYLRIPLLDKAYLGITRDNYSLQSWFNLFTDKTKRPEDIFYGMYDILVFGERAKNMIPQVFSVFAGDNDAVLWHCSAGKDRVGVITMLLLLALGVDNETIIEDFFATNRFVCKDIIKARVIAPFVIHNRWHRKCLAVLMGVKREYMEKILFRITKEYADTFDFFEKIYGIDKELIMKLRDKYLV